MNGITKRCISIGRGDKDPVKRVNYEFGLVLGVDEFVAEQVYFLEKAYTENRTLHGCGTVSGLHITVGENGDDLEVRVSPGIGIDQYGRMFTVTREQCASLLAWIEKNDIAPGETSIYVTARYNECLTDLVPISGQPCSNSDDLNGASRIKDIFAIELTLNEPLHEACDAVINLAEFISRLRVDNTIEDSPADDLISRLPNIIGSDAITRDPSEYASFITDIASDIAGTDGTGTIRIAPQDAERLREAIFVYWVTEVRPTLLPDILDPDAPVRLPDNPEPQTLPPDILLARIDVTLGEDDSLEEVDVSNERPYLLHTQLIQNLFRLPELADSAEAMPAPPMREFVSIYADDVQQVRLWIHIGQDIVLETLQDGLQLFRVGSTGLLNEQNFRIREETDRANDAGRYYIITTNARLNDDDYLLFVFDAETIRLESPNNRPVTLQSFIQRVGYTFLNYVPNEGNLLAYHIVHQPESADSGLSREEVIEIVRDMLPEETEPALPTVPFVTITAITQEEGRRFFVQGYEFWFHLDGLPELNDGAIDDLNPENALVFVEDDAGSVTQIAMQYEQLRPNVWAGFFADDNPRNIGMQLLRFVFVLDAGFGITAFHPENGDYDSFDTLREYIDGTGQHLQGHLTQSEQFGDVLIRYVREQGSARNLNG